MKATKRFKWLGIGGVVVLAVALCCAMLLGLADSQRGEDDAAIQNAILGVETVLGSMGKFDSPDGYTSSLSEEELDQLVADFNAQADLYFSQDNSTRDYYKTLNEYYLRECHQETEDSLVYYKVDDGVTDISIQSIDYGEDGTTATVRYVITIYGSWVEEEVADSFSITAIVNQDTMLVSMVKEDGNWKLLKIEDQQMAFEPEDDGVMAALFSVASGPSPSEQIVNQTYSSFEEALAAAQSVDMEELDPF